MSSASSDLPTIDHLGLLEDLCAIPPYLAPGHERDRPMDKRYSCSFCGVGDGAIVETQRDDTSGAIPVGEGTLVVEQQGVAVEYKARVTGASTIMIDLESKPPAQLELLLGKLTVGSTTREIAARRSALQSESEELQVFELLTPVVSSVKSVLKESMPTSGCVKMKISLGAQKPVFPIHLGPSVLNNETGQRTAIRYGEAIGRLADLLLQHRPPSGRTLIYACGQIDYFTVFSFQEVFRLLGIRNLAGNAEHCLNAGAVHNEMLTGQEGPFLTIDQALQGPRRFFLLNGWNGLITHPPVFGQLGKVPDLDAYLVEVVVTESARALARRLGPDRILLIRSGTDPHLALSVAHEILHKYPQAVEERFLDRYADRESFERYKSLAASAQFEPERVAERIAPEASLSGRLLAGIRDIAAKLAMPDVVPINLPSVGLSQTKGAVSHCLWGSVLGMLGKYGLKSDGSPAGGTLRIPGQINAQTEVQGLSHRFFMGRVRMTEEGIREATQRMGLPEDAYEMAVQDEGRCALDYSNPTEVPELFVCFGTQFESNMLGRSRWIRKLKSPNVKLVVVDPIPDPFTLTHADLIIPSPPHSAAPKLYQNGEWRMTVSVPRKRMPAETRSDATIVYDAMAEISRRIREDSRLRAAHPDLARHAESRYLRQRFESPEAGGGLSRIEGEVSRPELWERIQTYMTGPKYGAGPLYCRVEHGDGTPIAWQELFEAGTLIYGGVGTSRFRHAYEDTEHVPFRDIFRRPSHFRFFVPSEADLAIPEGPILISGRSTLSDDKKLVRFAVSTFNSGKATPEVDLPAENRLYVSLPLAGQLQLKDGDSVKVTGVDSGESLVFGAVPTDRVKGNAVYVSFHKTKAEIEEGQYLNNLTSHHGRCPYTAQSNFKLTRVTLEKAASVKPGDDSELVDNTNQPPLQELKA